MKIMTKTTRPVLLALLTVGRPKYASAEPLMKAVAEGAREGAERLLGLADEDAKSYDAVSAAYRLPKGRFKTPSFKSQVAAANEP